MKTQYHIYPTLQSLSKQAALFIRQLAIDCIETNGRFTMALSGGSTPIALFQQLAKLPASKKFPWKQTIIFWSDERCVPLSSPQSNAGNAFEHLFHAEEMVDENVFPAPVQLPPTQAASTYEQMIKTFFQSDKPVFDLILLGLGTDGHTASLFPGSPLLHEKILLVAHAHTNQEIADRITFTFPLINAAKNIAFLVTGKDKASIFKQVTSSTKKTYPAQYVKPKKGVLHWFADKAAAGEK